MSTIGILAGGGRLPLMIAESVTARGGHVHIVAIDGEADPAIGHFPHTWVNWGQIGRMVAALRRSGCRQLVIAGGVRRPDLRKVKPDLGFFASLPRLVGLMAGGDDSVLTRVVRFFEQKGFEVQGAHQVAPDLLAGAGRMGGVELSEQGLADARLGFAVRSALGPLDAGQAVVAARGGVLAIEGAEGTDAMLQRVAALPGRSGAVRSGVLAKGPKPGQELRVDMPAIGPRTVERAAAAHLEGIAVEAHAVLILDRADALGAADASGCAVEGLAGGAGASLPFNEVAPLGKLVRVIGRHQPNRRDAADIAKGLAVSACLAPFATGGAVVVSRAYILAIEAGEGVPAMLERVGALRQWGLKGKRRVGVLVRRVDTGEQDDPDLRALLSRAAVQGLAGVAAVGPASAVAAYEGAARLADELGLFVVTCHAA